jgi:hypothetical protein
MIIDAPVETEPVTWLVSKIKRFVPNGLNRITLAQDKFNQHLDYIEKDDDGNIIGMWADYYQEPIQPNSDLTTSIHSQIQFNGAKPVFKVGGSKRIFTVYFYDTENNEVDYDLGAWSVQFENQDIDNTLLNVITPEDDITLNENQIAVEFLGDDQYLGENIITKHINDNFETSVTMEIVAL